jgi:26S proteasome regulatory subunit N11
MKFTVEYIQRYITLFHTGFWLSLEDYNTHCTNNEKTVKEMLELAKNYHKACVGRIILKHIKE